MSKKYEMTNDFIYNGTRKLYRIKALKDFNDVKAGDIGGYIEKESNLSHEDIAWVYGDAKVYGNARVGGDAMVYGNATVYGDAKVYDNAIVCGDGDIKYSSDYTTIKGFGSVCRSTTFFRCKDNLVKVTCGCFYGTIDEFRNKVKETHGDSKYAKEYLMIADLMELHFAED